MSTHTLFDNLATLASIQPNSILSRTIYQDERLKAILFTFDAGQELSEHTTSQAAIIQLISGEARIGVGDELHELSAGAWLHMTPHLKHSVLAKTPLVMLLLMVSPA